MKNLLGESEVPISDKYFNFLVLSFSSCLGLKKSKWGSRGEAGQSFLLKPFLHRGIYKNSEEMKEEVVSFIYCSYFLSGMGFKFYLFCFI